MQFDLNRGIRKSRSMFKNKMNSLSMLTPLLFKNPNRENITLGFYSPLNIRGILDRIAPESGVREIKGTFHTKFMICDNDVILTGANLSEQYFVSRKDRYIIIKDCPELADYLEDFMKCFEISGEYYRVNEDFDETSKERFTNEELEKFYTITSKNMLKANE
jgi:CDP-diacylglycerol--glycerol-3-phosphate 3-phosphatidyltransferase